MDSAMLSLTCAGLGAAEEDDDGGAVGYVKGEHCLDNLKDLQRLLRRDDPERREVFKQVCKWRIASRDLVPIIENYQSDRNLVITAVKVLVFLTMPVDPSSEDVAQQIEYLWDLKAALTRNVAIAVIVSLLEDPLDHLERTSFTEDDWKLVQLVLTLFRNVLAIQEITLPQKASGEATQLLYLADSFLELMFKENMMDLILVLAQHIDEPSGYLKHENLLLLEIFHYLFLGRDPELIAKVRPEGSKEQVNGDIDTSVDSLRLMMEKEEREKRMFRQRNAENHALNGIFTCLAVDGSKSLCKGNPSSAMSSANSLRKMRNVQRGPQKRIAWDNELLYIPKEGIMEMLRSFMDQFLSGGYNVLMQSVCDDIVKQHHSIEKSDNITFFKVVCFVLAFQHEKTSNAQKSSAGPQLSETSPGNECDDLPFRGDICGPVAATLNEDMFNIVLSRWREAYEDLKHTKDYKTLSAAGSLMKNMIGMIYLVVKVHPEDSRESQTARVLLYKLFYDQTEQGLTQFLLNLFRSFDTHKQPKSALADLLETVHIMLQLMEKLQARGALRVAKRTRKGRKRKTSDDKHQSIEPETENVEQSCIDPTDGTKATSDSLPDLRSEDPLAEPTLLEQGKVDSDGTDLPDTIVDTAVNLESTTQLGGDPSSAGSGEKERNPINEEEDTCTTQLGGDPSSAGSGEKKRNPINEEEDTCTTQPGGDPSSAGSAEKKRNTINEEEDASDSSSDDCPPATSEVDFNVSRLISSLANNSVVQNICWLLKYYKTNSFRTNHYIICMLRRFCEDLDVSPMLYQLSLLTTFYDILVEQKSSSSKEYANIVNFLSKIVRKLVRAMKKQPLLFVDALFWKTRKECHCIDADYLLNEFKGDVNNKGGEVGSSKGWGGPVNIADSLGDDEADYDIPHEPYDGDKNGDSSSGEREGDTQKSMGARDKRSILLSLSDSEGEAEDNDRTTISRGSQNKEVPKRRGRSIFNEEQEKLIRDLHEKYKDDRKCSHLIAEALDPSGKISSAQISRKLTQLGLRSVTRRTKVPEASLSAEGLVTQPQNDVLDDPKPESTRRRRKRLHRLSSKDDNNDNHPVSSDEETLQSLKGRTKNKELPSVDLSSSKSQHQEASQGDSDDETIGSLLSRGKKKRLSTSDVSENKQEHLDSSKNIAPGVETIGSNIITKNKELPSVDLAPSISQHQEASQGTDSDDATIGSLLGRGKKKRLSTSDITENKQEDLDSSKNIGLGIETIGSNAITKNKELPSVDLVPSISQHQETSQGTDSDDETIGFLLRGKKKRLSTSDIAENEQDLDSSKNTGRGVETIGSNIIPKNKELASVDLPPGISQHQEASQGTDSDDETIGSLLRGKKRRLSTSDVTENRQEHQDSSKNIVPDNETVGSNVMDAPLHPELNSSNDKGGDAELLDDFSEPELDGGEDTEQRTIDDRDMPESGDMAGSNVSQKTGLKRRHRMVIDDDDDE
ncbi:protein timeless homolog isoform X2 [Triticum urartu]|uniref:protein timeless homolog isoform X2 n=1 Tax=Triticum urartu TaxID=4572 RepID=UPI002042CD32|nr:protein timeless homolog isoform X2 [Triticum urartu]